MRLALFGLTEMGKVENILEEHGYDYFIDILPTRGYDPFGGSKKTYAPYFYVLSEQHADIKQTLQNKGIRISWKKRIFRGAISLLMLA